ncbi:MAG: single-stranded-DNA-specific exonuclease RecJ [Verrucomicrobiaceae bacterium]
MEWILREVPEGWEELMQEGMPRILGKLLAQRGVTAPDVQSFLKPRLAELSDPFEIEEMDLAVERIFLAVDAGEKVCVYGDYDVDGVTSITLLQTILMAYGLEVEAFIPRRSTEGYGLSKAGVERCLSENGEPGLLVTVDCGTVSNDAIASLKERGIDTVVVDHHEMGQRGRPDCVALVNPKASGDERSYLCAAGVVFKLAHALLKQRPLENFDLKDVLDLVAVATISDIVPLVDENRLLVRHGLRSLEKSARPGLDALLKLAGVDGRLSSADVGFRIGPRLNAAGRMDQPEQALATLMTECPDEAKSLAQDLEDFNRSRQAVEQQIFAEAMEMLDGDEIETDGPVIVVGSRKWHAGVVGIVASRLMRMYHKPTFVISIDESGVGKGSGRSIEGVSLVEAITKCGEHLIAGGGHHMAAGLSIQEDSIKPFREAFSKYVSEDCRGKDLRPKIYLDAEVELGELSLQFLDKYDLLQPFGSANPQPVFMAKGVWLTEPPRRLKNNHLRLFLRQNFDERDAIFFGGGANQLPDPPWDIAFTIDRNVFRGRASLQISIQRVRASVDG